MKKHSMFLEIIIVTTAIILGISLAGCATSVPIKSVRTPAIDTSNVQRLTVREFENKSGVNNQDTAQLARYLTEKVTQIIDSTGRFTKVSLTDPNADGIFTGEIRSLTSKDSQDSRTVRMQGVERIMTVFTREVTLEFSYTIIDKRTGMPIREIIKTGTQSKSASSVSELKTLDLAKAIVDSQLRTLESDIVPTIVSTNRKLMNETSKDKVVKQRMKDTLLLVKSNNYEEAIRQYEEIANQYGSTAAKANAAILKEAIASDVAASARLSQLESERGSLSDRAVKASVEELYSKLPADSVIIIIEANSSDRGRLNEIVNNINRTVISEGKLKVVDRSQIMGDELQYQVSGNVSDDSYVSIGKNYGAQYIVFFDISGQMSTRQLNMRLLNIETSQVIHQTGFEI